VSLSDDLPPPRRPLFFPVVIATVFLTIIGMSAGFALGTRHKDTQDSHQSVEPVPDNGTPSEDQGIECPAQMQDTARRLGFSGTLTQVLRVRSADSETVVWICRDPDGSLYYQANRGDESARWVEGETALFLSGVQQDGDTYTAVAHDGNRFSVNDHELKVVTKNRTEKHDVQPE
jgi:hypothetical protein